MQFSLTDKELVGLVQNHVNSLVTVNEGARIIVDLVHGSTGVTAVINIVAATPTKSVPAPMIVAPTPVVVVPALVIETPTIVTTTAEERITAKFGPGPGEAAVVVTPMPVVTPTPVVSLFNKAKPPQTPAEVNKVMQDSYDAEDKAEAEAVVATANDDTTPPFEVEPVVAAAAIAETEVRKPTSLFKNLRKPVNA